MSLRRVAQWSPLKVTQNELFIFYLYSIGFTQVSSIAIALMSPVAHQNLTDAIDLLTQT